MKNIKIEVPIHCYKCDFEYDYYYRSPHLKRYVICKRCRKSLELKTATKKEDYKALKKEIKNLPEGAYVLGQRNTQGLDAECPKCGHYWRYTGKKRKDEYVTCPSCFHRSRADNMLVFQEIEKNEDIRLHVKKETFKTMNLTERAKEVFRKGDSRDILYTLQGMAVELNLLSPDEFKKKKKPNYYYKRMQDVRNIIKQLLSDGYIEEFITTNNIFYGLKKEKKE